SVRVLRMPVKYRGIQRPRLFPQRVTGKHPHRGSTAGGGNEIRCHTNRPRRTRVPGRRRAPHRELRRSGARPTALPNERAETRLVAPGPLAKGLPRRRPKPQARVNCLPAVNAQFRTVPTTSAGCRALARAPWPLWAGTAVLLADTAVRSPESPGYFSSVFAWDPTPTSPNAAKRRAQLPCGDSDGAGPVSGRRTPNGQRQYRERATPPRGYTRGRRGDRGGDDEPGQLRSSPAHRAAFIPANELVSSGAGRRKR
ncbi:hypothetical protein BC793_16510, partial [Actinoplanes xinjiangensis]